VGGAGGSGGGILGAASVTHATISANSAGAGGSSGGGAPGAPGAGGGAADLGGALTNTIASGNSPANCSGAIVDGGSNLSFPEASCPGLNADPLLGPLLDNGGATRTLALGAGSPARDAVPAVGSGCAATDQRGVARPQGQGCDTGAFEAEVAATPPGSQPQGQDPGIDTVAAVLTDVDMTNDVFAVGPGATAVSAGTPRGTTFRFTLSEPATVRINIRRAAKGRRRAGRCVKPRPSLRRARRCTRFVSVGTLTRSGTQGANSVRFTGRIGRKALRPRRHRAVFRATDAAGNRSRPVRLGFRVVRP
jgi:hypothetical protein